MKAPPSVQIIMGTYNGAQWIDDTLDSILVQDFDDWEILVRDDKSTDDTVAILKKWEIKLDDKMMILPDSGSVNLGAKNNGPKILATTKAPYVLFAGQDDVWLPDRISRTLKAFKNTEASVGTSTPTIVCSDAVVVDGQLRHIASSWLKWARIDPARIHRITDVAMESPVLGATMAVNRAMIDFALPIPQGFYDADSWLAMVAVAFGQLVVLPEQTIFYRRHGTNVTNDPFGASLFKAAYRAFASPLAPRRRLHDVLFNVSVPQAASFVEHYRDRLPDNDAVALCVLGRLFLSSPIKRRLNILRYQLWFSSTFKNLGLIILV